MEDQLAKKIGLYALKKTQKSALEMFFVDKGESFEGINALNQAISLLLKSSGEKHEDMSKHFELFKKVEIKFN